MARTSSTPGKTRSINYFLIGSEFYLVDLPGYGYAKAARTERRAWARLMDRYFCLTRPTPRVIQLVDAKVGATELDVQAIDYFRARCGTPTVVATKIDRLTRSRRPLQLAEIRRALSLADEEPLIVCSARSGEGVNRIWKEIKSLLRSTVGEAN